MRLFALTAMLAISGLAIAQDKKPAENQKTSQSPENIYEIKKAYLQQVLHNPTERGEDNEDNSLTRFNRWFEFAEQRTYPSGNLPSADVLLKASQEVKQAAKAAKTTAGGGWTSVGPTTVPTNYNGIGRINAIAIDQADTNNIYIGAACGGVWRSRNGGQTWQTNTDNFPSISIADIAINPKHRDTIYAATGDGYGYENGPFGIFWGGLYSAGVMMSRDSGNTWTTTGLSYLTSNQDMIQKLLLHPNKTSILLAATRNGLKRSTDAGATWTNVATGHIYSMAFHPTRPDTIYAINSSNLIISYNAGATWTTQFSGINASDDRCTIAVSPASPNSVWVLNDNDNLRRSFNRGASFTTTTSSPDATASFYGYYDRVLGVSPTDSNFVLAFGMLMAKSSDGGNNWSAVDPTRKVHVDYHAVAFNPLRPRTIFVGNDGGIFVSRNGGTTWTNISSGLAISQIYRMSSSRQNTSIMMCGLQDNGSFYNNGTVWRQSNAPSGDGMDNAIHPENDFVQVNSWQYGNFYLSLDQGASFSAMHVPTYGTGAWVSPVVMNPRNPDTMYFGMKKIYATYNAGSTFVELTPATYFTGGATSLAVGYSDPSVIYASDLGRIMATTNGGSTWTNVTGSLPSTVGITRIAVDYNNPQKIYATMSGFSAGNKVFMSTTGGTTWTNISTGLPNVPVSCIAVDSSTPGALFVGTDMGVYYRDDSVTSWSLYRTGLPNVIVDDLDINYTNYKIRAATFGRGAWEAPLKKPAPVSAPATMLAKHEVKLYPNPTYNTWKVMFAGQTPADYTVRVSDVAGRVVATQHNEDVIDAAQLARGVYMIEVSAGNVQETVKAVKY